VTIGAEQQRRRPGGEECGAGAVFLALQRTTMSQNSNFGVKMDGSGTDWSWPPSPTVTSDQRTGVLAQVAGACRTIQLTRSTVVHSTSVGAQSIGLNAFVFVSNTLMSGNATAVQRSAPAP